MNISDLDQTQWQWANVKFPRIRKNFPGLFSSQIKGVQPITQPQGIYFALRYIYDNGYGMKCPFEKDKNTPQLNLKYRKKIRLCAITPKEFLRPTYWSANPGKNEKFHVKVYK
jgi:hypothetical protein